MFVELCFDLNQSDEVHCQNSDTSIPGLDILAKIFDPQSKNAITQLTQCGEILLKGAF